MLASKPKIIKYPKKSHPAWNKGLRGVCRAWNKGIKWDLMVGNTNGFKKGQRPWNYKGGKKCIDCNGVVASRSVKVKRCSKCEHKRYRGSLVYNWKGGTKARYHSGEAFKIKKWAKDIYKRDFFTCQLCHKHCAKDIQAHHIKRWKDNKTLRFSLNNGITLCFKCHLKTRGIEDYYAPLFLEILRSKHNPLHVTSLVSRT